MQWRDARERERQRHICWAEGKTQKMKWWTQLKAEEVWTLASSQSHPVLPGIPALCHVLCARGYSNRECSPGPLTGVSIFYRSLFTAQSDCSEQRVRAFQKIAVNQVVFLEPNKTRGLLWTFAGTSDMDSAWIITCSLSRSSNSYEKWNMHSLLWLSAELLMGTLKLFVRQRFGEPKGAKDLKRVCWVLASGVDQGLRVGGLGKEPVEIGPGDGVILDSSTLIFWLSSKSYFFSLFCSSAQTSLSFSTICGMTCSTRQVQHGWPEKMQWITKKRRLWTGLREKSNTC